MSQETHLHLSRRERQIMDIIYGRGSATAAEVLKGLPDPPSYSAVRAMLRVLEEKGHLTHEPQKLKYVYKPTVARDKARDSALKRLVQTFFDGSTEKAVLALLDSSEAKLSDEARERLEELVNKTRKEGR